VIDTARRAVPRQLLSLRRSEDEDLDIRTTFQFQFARVLLPESTSKKVTNITEDKLYELLVYVYQVSSDSSISSDQNFILASLSPIIPVSFL